MRFLKLSLLLLLGCATVFAQGPTQKGVEVGDIDKNADPCTDFFQYANGKWRAEHPISSVDGPLVSSLESRRGRQGTPGGGSVYRLVASVKTKDSAVLK